MKTNRRTRTTLLFALLALAPAAHAQELKAISVKTVLQPDGTRVVTTTNPEEHTSEAVTYSGSDVVTQRVVYKLNEQNLASEGDVFDGKGRFLFKMKLVLNSEGKVAEESDYSQDGTLLRRLVFHYDTKGRFNKVEAYDGAGKPIQAKSAAKPDEKKNPPRRR